MSQESIRNTYFNWERWPFILKYLPIMPLWGWYMLRSRAVWFFTPSNPTISFGGFEGEGKKEMYEQLPPGSYPKTIYIEPGEPIEKVLADIRKNDFEFPFCAKPDVGMKGLLFRKVDSKEQLLNYHSKMPVTYLVQELVSLPMEVSIFYYRFPGSASGCITGFIQKDLLSVTGDGQSTLWQLILNHPGAQLRQNELKIWHKDRLEDVVEQGETFLLTHAANLSRGATFSDFSSYIDDTLLKIFDVISHSASFYYGRYDIKCESVEVLKENRFSILEFNGCGAEPNHVYHAGMSWLGALRVIARHWHILYQISRINHRAGISYWSFSRGWKFLQDGKIIFAKLKKADAEIEV